MKNILLGLFFILFSHSATAQVPTEDNECILKGDIKVENEGCLGRLSITFNNEQVNFVYSYQIKNLSGIIVEEASGLESSLFEPLISQPGDYTILLTVFDGKRCYFEFSHELSMKDCKSTCLMGHIGTSESSCVGSKKLFWFVSDPSTPLDYSNPNITFDWTVTDVYGNPVYFEPLYLFGSSTAHIIEVPIFGNYVVNLSIANLKCGGNNFERHSYQDYSCNCKGASIGKITSKDKEYCAGTKVQFEYDGHQPGNTYTWNFFNSNYETIYTVSGQHFSASNTFNHAGQYLAMVTVKDVNGCEQDYFLEISIDDCGDRCLYGTIKNNTSLCSVQGNYFWFEPDQSTPLDYSDPNLTFEWNVYDENGNSIPFTPLYFFGSTLPFHIQISTDANNYTVRLVVSSSKCKYALFEKDVRKNKKCDCGIIKGDVVVRAEKVCSGEEINFIFDGHQQGFTYSWNIINSNYASVYSSSGQDFSISALLAEAGTYTVMLFVSFGDGCEQLVTYELTVKDCSPPGGGEECYYHLAFSFAMPIPEHITPSRFDASTGLTNFINNNADGKLFVTTADDYFNGARFTSIQSLVTEPWLPPVTVATGEISAANSVGNNLVFRVQENDYPNTVSKMMKIIESSSQITMPIDVNFIFITKDANTIDIAEDYWNLVSSGKVKKVFFVLFTSGNYLIEGQTKLPSELVSDIIGHSAVHFSPSHGLYASDYIVIDDFYGRPSAAVTSFLKDAFSQVKNKTGCNNNGDCLNGSISTASAFCTGMDNQFWFSPSGSLDISDPTLQFHWTVFKNGLPMAFQSLGTTNMLINFNTSLPGNYTVTLVVRNSTCIKTFTKAITITRCNTAINCGDSTNQYYVVQLFKELLDHLKGFSSLSSGYTCPQLAALAPYINPGLGTPKIYDFSNVNNTIRFSFAPGSANSHVVFNMAPGNSILAGLTIGNNYVNMNSQASFVSSFFTFNFLTPTFIPVPGSSVSQVNFCPQELSCINHIAIVLDESTSINTVDAGRIRGQLKNFINQQVSFNQTMGIQTKISLIGLSDRDNDVRNDNIINLMANIANKQTFLTWINRYKLRYNIGLPGVSSNSDYWNSGLAKAAQSDASLVILITDGAQTANVGQLKNTLSLYNNAGNTNQQRHLYVLGLNDGYYITTPSGPSVYSQNSNPNLVAGDIEEEPDYAANFTVQNTSSSNSLTNFLRISLRSLIYSNTQFPDESLYDFSKDYSGHDNFKFLYDDPYYLSNGIFKFSGETCGAEQYLKRCDDCDGVQLDLEKSYIISAWVHVDKTQQVASFREAGQSPSIEVLFCDEGDIDQDLDDPENVNTFYLSDATGNDGTNYPGRVEFFPQGNIIDGWQRIFGMFGVHPGTEYLKIILNNGSKSDAMHFDDIRIHPREGSMKSFVYDEETYKLMSELDENNYSTYYEYDSEGGLVRVKKETERGIKTIQETRSGSVIKAE